MTIDPPEAERMVVVASLDLFNMTKFIIRCWTFNAYSPPREGSMFDVHQFLHRTC